jgi:hypothetical protein
MNHANAQLLRTWTSRSLLIAFLGYLLITIIATTQGLTAGPKVYEAGGRAYIDYNNFRIFKFSFYHLIHNQDIYRLFPDDHWDLYKYSPAFALSFGLLSWMPDILGLFLWNAINALCLFAGIRLLPGLSDEKKSFILLFCLLEMLLSIQNTQSNGLMAGLIVLAFAFAERRNYLLSTLCVVFSFYIKIYGALAFVMYLFYPGKIRLFGWTLFWMAFFALVPLVAISWTQLVFLYHSWWHLLIDDRSASTGVSVMGIMVSWFGLPGAKNGVTLAGIVLFLLPLIHIRRYKELSFRFLYLASVLIWMVIFNHKAESPTYIIVMSGIGIWYWSKPSVSMTDRVLLIVSFLLITMSVSDLVPAPVRNGFIRPYGIKAVMAIVVWLRIVYQQLVENRTLKPA